MKWILLSLGIFFEIVALVFMKKSDGFTKLFPILYVLLFYALALGCLILVLRQILRDVQWADSPDASLVL